jgi:hypothetical protein
MVQLVQLDLLVHKVLHQLLQVLLDIQVLQDQWVQPVRKVHKVILEQLAQPVQLVHKVLLDQLVHKV